MSDVITEETDMATQNHALIQGNIVLEIGGKYRVAIDLSLDMSTSERQEVLKKHGLSETTRELKPDLAFYNTKEIGFIKPSKGRDKIRVMEPPLLCVEIVSPSQSSSEIINKVKVYLELGVKSCWYVDPVLETIHVYTGSLDSKEVFYNTTLIDHTLGIEIPLEKIFY